MMPKTRHIDENDTVDSGMINVQTDIAPEQVQFLKNLIDSFNKSADELNKAYISLQDKFDRLNLQLEETNIELKKSLEEKDRLSNYLTNILESLTSGVLVVDSQGIITLFNRGAEIMTGIETSNAIGKFYTEIMGDDMPVELTPAYVLNEQTALNHLEKTVVSASGENIPVGFSISPLLNSSGELIGAVEIFMDLSRIKALENELSRMDKLAALGQMSATMAHKIRNPLGGIAGYAGLIGTRRDIDDKAHGHVKKITEGVDKINHIITSVLSYNSALNLRPVEIDLGGWLDEIVDMFRRELEEDEAGRIGFSIIQTSGTVRIELDTEKFGPALFSIMKNSVESIEGDGSIALRLISGKSGVETSCSLTEKLITEIKTGSKLIKSKRPSVILIVKDSGCGMDDETKKNLFVPFFTTKEKGIGLGLAFARKIIEAHHGELWIESSPVNGTAAGIILPLRHTFL